MFDPGNIRQTGDRGYDIKIGPQKDHVSTIISHDSAFLNPPYSAPYTPERRILMLVSFFVDSRRLHMY